MAQDIHGSGNLHARTGPQPTQPLTDDQDRFVTELFKKYVPENLSAEDAVEIIAALESAGIRGPDARVSMLTARLDSNKFIAHFSPENCSAQRELASNPSVIDQ